MYHRHKYVSLNFNIPDVIDRLAHALASRFTSGDAELAPEPDSLPPAADEPAGQGLTGFTQAQEQPDSIAAAMKSNAADHMPQSSSAPATLLKSGSIPDSDRITNDINKSYGTMSKSDWNKFLSERPRFKTQYAAVTNKVNELAKTGSPLPNIKGAFNDPNVSYVRNLNRVLSQTSPALAPKPEFDMVSHYAAQLGGKFGYMSADDWDSFLKAHKGFKAQYGPVYDYISNLKAEGKPLPNVASAFKAPGSWVRDFNGRLWEAEHRNPAPDFLGPVTPAEGVHSNIEAWKQSSDYVDSIKKNPLNPPMFTRRSLFQGMLPHQIREQILTQRVPPGWNNKILAGARTFYYPNDLLEGKGKDLLPEGHTFRPEYSVGLDPLTGESEVIPKSYVGSFNVEDPNGVTPDGVQKTIKKTIRKLVEYDDIQKDDKGLYFSPKQMNDQVYGRYGTTFDYDAYYKANPEQAPIPYSVMETFFKKHPEYREIAYLDPKRFQQLFVDNPELADEITGKHTEYITKSYPQFGETVKIPKDMYAHMINPQNDYIKVPRDGGGSVWTPVWQWKWLRAQGLKKVPTDWGETSNYLSGGRHS